MGMNRLGADSLVRKLLRYIDAIAGSSGENVAWCTSAVGGSVELDYSH